MVVPSSSSIIDTCHALVGQPTFVGQAHLIEVSGGDRDGCAVILLNHQAATVVKRLCQPPHHTSHHWGKRTADRSPPSGHSHQTSLSASPSHQPPLGKEDGRQITTKRSQSSNVSVSLPITPATTGERGRQTDHHQAATVIKRLCQPPHHTSHHWGKRTADRSPPSGHSHQTSLSASPSHQPPLGKEDGRQITTKRSQSSNVSVSLPITPATTGERGRQTDHHQAATVIKRLCQPPHHTSHHWGKRTVDRSPPSGHSHQTSLSASPSHQPPLGKEDGRQITTKRSQSSNVSVSLPITPATTGERGRQTDHHQAATVIKRLCQPPHHTSHHWGKRTADRSPPSGHSHQTSLSASPSHQPPMGKEDGRQITTKRPQSSNVSVSLPITPATTGERGRQTDHQQAATVIKRLCQPPHHTSHHWGKRTADRSPPSGHSHQTSLSASPSHQPPLGKEDGRQITTKRPQSSNVSVSLPITPATSGERGRQTDHHQAATVIKRLCQPPHHTSHHWGKRTADRSPPSGHSRQMSLSASPSHQPPLGKEDGKQITTKRPQSSNVSVSLPITPATTGERGR